MRRVFFAVLLAVIGVTGQVSGQGSIVHFSKLLPLLPEPPEGWTAEEPTGSTTDAGEFQVTVAGRSYTKGDQPDAPEASVNITDTAANKDLRDSTMESWKFSQESTDGYAKGVTVAGNKGFEVYDKDSKTTNLWIIVADRFLVQVEVVNLEPAEAQAWMSKLDPAKLATLKK